MVFTDGQMEVYIKEMSKMVWDTGTENTQSMKLHMKENGLKVKSQEKGK